MSNQDTFGNRLKLAREAERYSRSALAEKTGIPMKSLEKFEYGEQEPNLSRLQLLAETLKVTVEYLMYGKSDQFMDDLDLPDPAVTSSPSVLEQLKQLDDMRLKGFEKFWRSAPRLIALVESEIVKLSEDELLDLAEVRSLYPVKVSSSLDDEDIAAVVCRIVDTAYFGIDLVSLKVRALKNIADDLEIEKDEEGILFDSWSSEAALISSTREVLRRMALSGEKIDFCNEQVFPKREVA